MIVLLVKTKSFPYQLRKTKQAQPSWTVDSWITIIEVSSFFFNVKTKQYTSGNHLCHLTSFDITLHTSFNTTLLSVNAVNVLWRSSVGILQIQWYKFSKRSHMLPLSQVLWYCYLFSNTVLLLVFCTYVFHTLQSNF